MDSELQKYEQLASPASPKGLKSKAPPISATLAELRQQLELARDQFLIQPDAVTPQQTFQKITANIEAAKAKIDERLKETHASGTKIAKLVDKVRTSLSQSSSIALNHLNRKTRRLCLIILQCSIGQNQLWPSVERWPSTLSELALSKPHECLQMCVNTTFHTSLHTAF